MKRSEKIFYIQFYDEYSNYKNAITCLTLLELYGVDYPPYLVPYLNGYYEYIENTDQCILNACYRLYESKRKRAYRLRKRIESSFDLHNAIFLTLTFDDFHLDNFTLDDRRKFIIDYLTSLECPCVANIDFGDVNGREHYHALVSRDSVEHNSYNLGAINFKRVTNSDHFEILSKYLSKLIYHQIKSSTQLKNIIYINC